MTFTNLSKFFDQLETTSSRLLLIDILVELFKSLEAEEVPLVCYLLQSRIAPFYEPLEFGMGEKNVASAIAKSFAVTREEVLADYSKTGDLGVVAEKLSIKNSHSFSTFSIAQVFEKLTEIAKYAGEGTVDRKVNGLSEILVPISPSEAKHLVRIPLGISRLGVGDPTILDAFALLKLGDRSKRSILESAYNKVSDLGLVGAVLWQKGLPGIAKMDVVVGRPIRSQLAERLPNPQSILKKFDGLAHIQFKYDGFRCVTGFTPVYLKFKGITAIRDLEVGDLVLTQTGDFKPVIAKVKRPIKPKEALFRFQTFLGQEIKITHSHPILCFINGKEEWKLIEEVRPGDWVVFPKPIFPPNNPHPAPTTLNLQTISGYRKSFKLDRDFYRFLGFWIGDGFTNDFHNTERVGLLFNGRTEVELSKIYESIILKKLKSPSVTKTNSRGCLTLYWRDEPLKHWLSSNFRREWVGKMIPEWFCHLSKPHFQQFLQGWIDSDGHIGSDGVTHIITKERDLAAFAQLVGLSHHIIIGLRYERNKKYNKTYYKLIIPASTRNAKFIGDRLLVKVLKNEVIKYRDPRIQLYDIQIADNESFCIPMATLHNCQIHKDGQNVRLFSRNLEETTASMPDIVAGVLSQVSAKTVILDSEALAYNPLSEEFLPFQETTKRRRKHGVAEAALSLPLRAMVFDIMYLDGQSLMDEPVTTRVALLEKVIKGTDILIPQPGQITSDPKLIQTTFDEALTEGLEGLIVKRPDSRYEAGARNFNWVKQKRNSSGELIDTIDCVILGFLTGRGKRADFGAGALLVGVYDKSADQFVTVAKIGTGLTDAEWRDIFAKCDKIKLSHKPARVESLITPSVWVEPKIVVEILADEITRSPIHTAGKIGSEPGYALRFPRLVRFREDDKSAEDATSVDELKDLYKLQFNKTQS